MKCYDANAGGTFERTWMDSPSNSDLLLYDSNPIDAGIFTKDTKSNCNSVTINDNKCDLKQAGCSSDLSSSD